MNQSSTALEPRTQALWPQTFDRIVVGFDGRDGGRDALALAEALASDRGIITAVMVCPYAPLSIDGGRLDQSRRNYATYAEAVEQDALYLATEACRQVQDHMVETETVEGGSPARGLMSIAEQRQADLIVVGSSHRGRIGRVLPGSVGRAVLTGAPCPVAVAPQGFFKSEARDGEVGVGYDGSPESREALELAIGLARERGTGLRLIGAVEPPGVLSPEGAWATVAGLAGEDWPEGTLRWQIRERTLEQALEHVPPDVTADARTAAGPASKLLSEESEDLGMLVVGSRGYGPARRALLGSTSTALLDGAACPVLVVPRPGRGSPDRGSASEEAG